mgnify:CR=1 FL=1
MQQSALANIREFLNRCRFAMIGVSRDEKHFSRALYSEFLKNGYDVVPVNRGAEEIAGARAFHHIADVTPPVSAALILTPDDLTEQAVHESHAAGIRNLWLYGIAGMKPDDNPVLQFCAENEISVVPGYCPFMFLDRSSKLHHFHGFLLKLVGKYPR